MLLIAGTIPQENIPLIMGKVSREKDYLIIENYEIPCTQGTSAMITAALEITEYLGIEPPVALLAGDIGDAKGSRAIYKEISHILSGSDVPHVLSLHYIQPIMGLMKKVCKNIKNGREKPVMIADAGAMYAAKAAGLSKIFDLFTPDAAEIRFLADTEAMHPAYISNFLWTTLKEEVPKMSQKAYKKGNCPDTLLIKGSKDYVIKKGEIVNIIDEPDVPFLEPIGGTGDTITGVLSALIAGEMEFTKAAAIAAKANRMAGKYADVRPDTRIIKVIDQFKNVFTKHFSEWYELCERKEQD